MGDFISGLIFLVAIGGIGYLVVKRIMKKREDRANRPKPEPGEEGILYTPITNTVPVSNTVPDVVTSNTDPVSNASLSSDINNRN